MTIWTDLLGLLSPDNPEEEAYLELQRDIMDHGCFVGDRTGTGVYSVLGRMLRFKVGKHIPLLTTKYVNKNLVIGEALWMLSGSTCLETLRKYQNKEPNTPTIWSKDYEKFAESLAKIGQDPEGDLKRVYGHQMRNFYAADAEGQLIAHDQIKTLIENIRACKEDAEYPMGRRLLVFNFNPYDHTVGDKLLCALPACHTDWQCIVRNGTLHLRFSMRSNDVFLGLPFNIAFYAFVLRLLSEMTGLECGELIYFGTDVHIYSNHIKAVEEQQERTPRPFPKLIMPKGLENMTIDEITEKFTAADFDIVNYKPHGKIYAKQAS